MACAANILREVPLFSLLDDDEISVLAGQVDLKHFDARQRIYKRGDSGGRAYILVSGGVRVTTIDEDQQEVTVNEPVPGEFFGFASMLDQTLHQTDATATDNTSCIEIDREDITVLLQTKPHAGLDILTVLGRQIHAAQELVRIRSLRNPNDMIEEESTFGQRIADEVARFGGSWAFIITFAIILIVYTAINIFLDKKAWDPYPFILLNLFLSMIAAVQAPVIMMSQNRQDQKDRLRSELDFAVNRRAELEIQGLAQKLNLLSEKLGDVEDLLRERNGEKTA
jgi:CRP/FNR family cyclic AMP-dependent transcriptional regulator